MNLTQIFSILGARRKVALAVFLITVLTTLLISLLLPKQYSATASVVIDAKPDPLSAMMYPGMTSPGYIATQIDVIQSDRVAQRVVRNLQLAENQAIRGQWMQETKGEGSFEVWMAETFQKSLEVRPARESSVLQVTYRAPDPRFAAALANAFVKAYLDVTLELRIEPAKQYNAFFDDRLKEARDALELAQNRVSNFQREKGIIATDERLDIETSRLNELSTQVVMLQSMMADSGSRQSQAQGTSADRMQEVLSNSVISGLKVDLSRAEARLQELTSRLGENHPSVVEAKASISDMRAKMEAETKRVTGGVVLNNSLNRQRENEIRASLEAQRNKVLQLKATRDEGSVLLRDVENAQRAYDAVQARRNQSSLESQTTQSNISFLTQATPPLQASSPKIVLNTFLAVFLGALLALGCVFTLEMMDRRVRTSDDILQTLGLPLIGVLNGPVQKGLFKKRLANTSQFQRDLLTNTTGTSTN